MILGHVGAEQEIQALKCELEKKDESDILAVYPLIFDCGVEKLLTLQEDVSEIQALYHPTQVTGENAKEQIRSLFGSYSIPVTKNSIVMWKVRKDIFRSIMITV